MVTNEITCVARQPFGKRHRIPRRPVEMVLTIDVCQTEPDRMFETLIVQELHHVVLFCHVVNVDKMAALVSTVRFGVLPMV